MGKMERYRKKQRITEVRTPHLLRVPYSFSEDFVLEFTEKMRLITDAYDMPSPRQSIYMHKLLCARFMNKGHLTYQDFIEIATVTSKTKTQQMARNIAWKICRFTHELPPANQNFLRMVPIFGDETGGSSTSGGKSGLPEKIYMGEENGEEKKDKAFSKEEKLRNSFVQRILNTAKKYILRTGNKIFGYNKMDEFSDIFEIEQVNEIFDLDSIGFFPGRGGDTILKFFLEADNEVQSKLKGPIKSRLKIIGLEFQNIGCKPRYTLKPFEIGDDPSFIDEERSIENIFVDLGKTADDIMYNDFLIRKRVMRPKTVIFLQDISNSMYLQYNKTRSISYTMLALIPLIHALRKMRYGLAFFESNTHVIKDLFSEKTEDDIIDTLLFLGTSPAEDIWKRLWMRREKGERTWGGTSPNMSLMWANEQFKKIQDRTIKVCFIFSDFAFQDAPDSEEYKTVKSMLEHGVKVFACVPPIGSNEKLEEYVTPIISKFRLMGCEFMTVNKPREFLQRLGPLLDNL